MDFKSAEGTGCYLLLLCTHHTTESVNWIPNPPPPPPPPHHPPPPPRHPPPPPPPSLSPSSTGVKLRTYLMLGKPWTTELHSNTIMCRMPFLGMG